MPKSSRVVAQRYAAASRKRRKSERPQPTVPAVSPTAATADSQAPAAALSRTTATPPVPTLGPRPVTRRASVDYTEHYRYVWADIRRIAVIAGGLMLGLIGLSFVIR